MAHRPTRECISRQNQYSEDSNEFSLSIADKGTVGLIPVSRVGHTTWSLICPDLISSNAPWLSINTRVGSDCVIPKESSKAQCQRTSFTAVNATINSASTVDSDTLDCFFDPQEITPPSNNNVYSDIDFLSILSPAQSESTYAIGGASFVSSVWNSNLYLLVPRR